MVHELLTVLGTRSSKSVWEKERAMPSGCRENTEVIKRRSPRPCAAVSSAAFSAGLVDPNPIDFFNFLEGKQGSRLTVLSEGELDS